jgi:hypothetical protein
VQNVLPLSAVAWPAGQRSQAVLFGCAAYVPGLHCAQLVALPPADQRPDAHWLHAVPLTNEPGAHSS